MNQSQRRSISASAGPGDAHGAADVSLATSSALATAHSLLRVVLRRRGLWVGSAIAGVTAGILLSLFFPPRHTATTTLLLQHGEQGDPAQAMATDAQLLRTRTVAQAAIDDMGLRLSPKDLVSDSRVAVLTPDILKLTVAGPTAAAAVRRAAGVADAFLTFRREEYERQSREEVNTLARRASDVNAQLAKVSDSINNFGSRPDAASDSRLRAYGDLLSEKATLNGQLGQLQQRIDTATVAPALSVVKSRVLDPATADQRSAVRAMAANSGSGLIGGMALGVTWILLQGFASDKVHRSKAVALAIQAPLAITTGRLRRLPQRDRNPFLGYRPQPPADLGRVVEHWRQLVSRSATAKPVLAVLSIGADKPAALLVACTAADLANEGDNVLVADLSDRSVLASFFAVAAQGTSTVHVAESVSSFRVTFPSIERRSNPGTASLLAQAVPDADRVLFLIGENSLHQPVEFAFEWGTKTVAVVPAGGANAVTLRSTGDMLKGAGLELDHVVVVNADPDDRGGDPWSMPPVDRGPAVAQALTVPSGEPT